MRIPHLPGALSAATLALLLPLHAQAMDLVNTSTPSGGLIGANSIDGSDWLAERFTVTQSVHIDSVLAYLLSSDEANDTGKTFTLALYANSASQLPLLDWSADQHGQLFQTTASYSGAGWNGVSGLNWSVGPGSYWLALELNGDASNATALVAPSNAQPNALSVAYSSDANRYQLDNSRSDTFGLRITATPAVPEPGSLALLLAGMGVAGVIAQRRAMRG